ncbi:MAG: hypothetical protein WAL77_02695 [Candidatus Dormiibacterota bacterium]
MTFINTKGMAFIGPGSEWFWAALQFTALAITFIAIYRQVRLARSGRAVELVNELSQQFDDERILRHRLAILVAARDKREIPAGAGIAVGNYFEGLGSLSRSGHLDIKLLCRLFGSAIFIWWTVLEPYVQQWRAEQGHGVYEDFEWLTRTLIRMDHRARRPLGIDAVSVPGWLTGGIEGLQDRIRVEQAPRIVTIASPDSTNLAQSAGAAPAPNPSASLTAEDQQDRQSD